MELLQHSYSWVLLIQSPCDPPNPLFPFHPILAACHCDKYRRGSLNRYRQAGVLNKDIVYDVVQVRPSSFSGFRREIRVLG